MYNGIGLVTPRGSGTNGYVVRNLSHIRPRETQQDIHKFDQGPPKHREPDEGILEHERLRKVEIRCLELQLELEDNNIPEEDIEREVSKLRAQLTEAAQKAPMSGKNLKPTDTHGLAAAKKEELSKMARALGTSANYVEGDAFNREKQDELRRQRAVEREENDRRREGARLKREEDNKLWEAERKERDRLRRRKEDQERKEREARMGPPQSGRGRDGGSYSRRSPPPRDYSPRRRDRSPPRRRSPSPYSRRSYPPRRSHSRSRSPRRPIERSPPRRDSRSPSPPRRAARSPSPRRGRDSRSPSPPRRRRSSSPMRDASPPPRGRSNTKSPSPKPKRARSRSSESAMSVSGSESN